MGVEKAGEPTRGKRRVVAVWVVQLAGGKGWQVVLGPQGCWDRYLDFVPAVEVVEKRGVRFCDCCQHFQLCELIRGE